MFYRPSKHPLKHKVDLYFDYTLPLADFLATVKNAVSQKNERSLYYLTNCFAVDDSFAYRLSGRHVGQDNSGSGNTETQKPSS